MNFVKSVVLVLLSLVIISCGPERIVPENGSDSGNNGTQGSETAQDKPDDEVVPTLLFNGKSFTLNSVAYYYDSEEEGYSILFSTSELDLSNPIIEAPDGFSVVIDVPKRDLGFTPDLKKIIETPEWKYILRYSIDGIDIKFDKSPLIYSNRILNGDMYVTFDEKNELDFDFHIELVNGDVISIRYRGEASISDYYLGWSF